MCSQGWEARPPLVAAYSNLKFKLGYNCRVNPLVLEELGKNADSASFRFRHQGPGICISVHRLPHPIPKPLPARSRDPGTPTPGVQDHTERDWGQERGGPRPAGDRGVVQGAGGG